MTLTQFVPVAAYAAVGLYMLATLRGNDPKSPGLWRVPAAISAAFLVWSGYTVLTEGPLQFWINHTTNLTGTQVWIDLVLAIALGWTLVLPRARRHGMNLPVWFVLVILTASIALFAMLARVLWLEERRSAAGA